MPAHDTYIIDGKIRIWCKIFDFELNFKQKRTKIDVQTKTFFIKFIPNFQILIFNFSAIRCKLGFGGSAGVHTFQKSDLTLFGCARQLLF